MFTATVVGQLAAVGTMFLLATHLGVEQFGQLATALAAQALVATFTHNGLRHPVIRELIAHPSRFDGFACSYFAVCLGLSLLAAGIAIGSALSLSLDDRETWVWIIIAVGNLANAMQPNPVFDALRKPAVTTIVAAVMEMTGLLIVLLAIRSASLSLVLAAIILVAKWTGTTVVLWWVLLRKHHRLSFVLDSSCIKQLCGSGFWVGGTSLLQATMITSATILARWFGGTEAAAFMGLGQYALRAHQMIFTLINRLVSPILAERIRDRRAYGNILWALVGFSVILGIAGMAAAWLATEFVLPASYRDSLLIFVLLLIAAIVANPASTANMALIMDNQERWGFLSSWVAVGIFFGWSFWRPAQASDAMTVGIQIAYGLILSFAVFAILISIGLRFRRT